MLSPRVTLLWFWRTQCLSWNCYFTSSRVFFLYTSLLYLTALFFNPVFQLSGIILSLSSCQKSDSLAQSWSSSFPCCVLSFCFKEWGQLFSHEFIFIFYKWDCVFILGVRNVFVFVYIPGSSPQNHTRPAYWQHPLTCQLRAFLCPYFMLMISCLLNFVPFCSHLLSSIRSGYVN